MSAATILSQKRYFCQSLINLRDRHIVVQLEVVKSPCAFQQPEDAKQFVVWICTSLTSHSVSDIEEIRGRTISAAPTLIELISNLNVQHIEKWLRIDNTKPYLFPVW